MASSKSHCFPPSSTSSSPLLPFKQPHRAKSVQVNCMSHTVSLRAIGLRIIISKKKHTRVSRRKVRLDILCRSSRPSSEIETSYLIQYYSHLPFNPFWGDFPATARQHEYRARLLKNRSFPKSRMSFISSTRSFKKSTTASSSLQTSCLVSDIANTTRDSKLY